MRTTFVRTLARLAEKDPNLILLTGDLGFTVFEDFRARFPNQLLNVGIAEQNMIGVAAGLALSGKRVFVYSIVPFVTFRCLEQIRNDLCHQHLPVCIVGVGGGYSYGHLGATHHALEDLGVMRTMPNMTVVSPGDPWEVEQAVLALGTLNGPGYLRLGKNKEPLLHQPATISEFVLGKSIVMRGGDDVTILATGTMLETALLAAALLESKKIQSTVISVHTLKPIDRQGILAAADNKKLLITIEEHGPFGGLADAISRIIAEEGLPVQFLPITAPESIDVVTGSHSHFRSVAGLTAEKISARILERLKK